MSRAWTRPVDIRARLERLWERGLLLAPVPGEADFPLRIRLQKPNSQEIAERFVEVRDWIRILQESSRAACGSGYELAWGTFRHRQLGSNALPSEAVIPTRDDALALLHRHSDAEHFGRLQEQTASRCPVLLPWIREHPLQALASRESWDSLLCVVAYFTASPRPDIYLRQIDVQGIDTKFIEANRALIATLLDFALPPEQIDWGIQPSRSFERRYGLRVKPALLRMRVLDPRLAVAGLTDITAPVQQLGCMTLSPAQIIITENEINGLSLPERSGTIAIFGLGYATELLAGLPWLEQVPIAYWGDIDTHGFAMLDRVRQHFPQARSLLMDAETFLSHRQQWVAEPVQHRGPLERLTPQEQALYEDLGSGRLGRNLRLEQERIAFKRVLNALHALEPAAERHVGPLEAASAPAAERTDAGGIG